MTPAVSVRSSRARALRCAICHDDLAASARCPRCASAFHADCREALGRCPSLGCTGVLVVARRVFDMVRALGISFASAIVASTLICVAGLMLSTADCMLAFIASSAAVLAFAFHVLVLPVVWLGEARPHWSLAQNLFDAVGSGFCLGTMLGLAAISLALIVPELGVIVAIATLVFAPAIVTWVSLQANP